MLGRKTVEGTHAVVKGGHKLQKNLSAALHEDRIAYSSSNELRNARTRQGHQSSGRFN